MWTIRLFLITLLGAAEWYKSECFAQVGDLVRLEYNGDACCQKCLPGIAEIVCLNHSPFIQVSHTGVEKPVSPAQHMIE